MSMIDLFKHKTMTEKALDKADDTEPNSIPIGFKEEACKTIRPRGFSEAQLVNCTLNFRFLRNTTESKVFFF
jgi:hypothetical protein